MDSGAVEKVGDIMRKKSFSVLVPNKAYDISESTQRLGPGHFFSTISSSRDATLIIKNAHISLKAGGIHDVLRPTIFKFPLTSIESINIEQNTNPPKLTGYIYRGLFGGLSLGICIVFIFLLRTLESRATDNNVFMHFSFGIILIATAIGAFFGCIVGFCAQICPSSIDVFTIETNDNNVVGFGTYHKQTDKLLLALQSLIDSSKIHKSKSSLCNTTTENNIKASVKLINDLITINGNPLAYENIERADEVKLSQQKNNAKIVLHLKDGSQESFFDYIDDYRRIKFAIAEHVEHFSWHNEKVSLKCPGCGKSLKGVTFNMIGDIGICQKCKNEFKISIQQEHA